MHSCGFYYEGWGADGVPFVGEWAWCPRGQPDGCRGQLWQFSMETKLRELASNHTNTHTLAGFSIMNNRIDLYLDNQLDLIKSIIQVMTSSCFFSIHNTFISVF